MIDGYPFTVYRPEKVAPEGAIQKSLKFYEWIDRRRSVRDFSEKPVSREVIENLLLSASTAPSGAHKQP